MAKDKVSNLYNAFVKNGYAMEPEAQFRENLKDPKKRKAAYDALVADGYNMESFSDFESNIGYGAPKPPATPAKPASTPAPTAQPTAAPAKPATPQQAQQSAWQPTEQDKIRVSYEIHTMLNDSKQKSKARAEQIKRMAEPFTPEGRKKRAAGKFQARLAGSKTTAGLGFDASSGAIYDGGSPQPYGVKYVDGKPVTEWVMPDGSLTTSQFAADRAEDVARRNRLQHQFESRMKQNGLDPARQEDVEMQAQLDAQAPAYDVVADLWREAEEKHKADRERNADKHWDSYAAMGGGREMRVVTTSMNRHDDDISHMTRFDLQKMMDNAWTRVGSKVTANCYDRLRKQYPGASEEELQATASQMARQLSDNAVYRYAVQQNTPKSTLEYFGHTVADMNVINSISKGLARSQAGTSGDLPAYEAAMGEYGKNHRVAQIGGTVVGMAIDPVTWVSGGVGSLAGKGAISLGGRFVASRAATSMSTQVGSRLFSSSLTGRILTGAASGGANFATYEMLKEGESQFLHGGHVNAETGEVEGYSAGDILKAGGHGLILGSVTGTLTPVVGNVADKYVKATTSTAGKAGVRFGEVAVSTVAEGTVFAMPEWHENSKRSDSDPNKRGNFDIWSDNMAMMLGFKAQHGIKSAPRVIASLRPIKPTNGRPLTMAERNHNRMDFEERLRRNLDASPRDMSFTADEREELRQAGYGELADLFSRDRVQEVQRPDVNPAEGAIELRTERGEAETISRNPEFDGYSAMEDLMQDGRVSQAARAKAYYVLTGRMLPMGTITGYTTTKTDDGRVTVNATTADGEVVTSRTFKNEQAAKQETDNIMRQAELNSIDVGERYTDAVADDMVLDAAISEVSPGADPATIKRIYRAVKAGNKDVTEAQRQLADFLDDAIERNKDIADSRRPEAIREALKEETGIDVDAVLRKMPSKRTEAEQEVVKTYAERLFPEESRQRNAQPSPEQEEAQSQYQQGRELFGRFEEGDPTAQADVDAIALRMQEAYQAVEDAFGTEAEYYMFHVNENPWALVNDPELTIEQQDAVLYYINAKAALDGVMDASNEAADRKRTEVEQSVAKRTHKDKGLIIPATMKVDDRQVYIVKGDVVMFPDGTAVDVRNSSESVVVMDAQTGEYEFTSPDQIFKVSDSVNPQDEVRAAHAVIEQEQMGMFGDNAVAPEKPIEESAKVSAGEQQRTEIAPNTTGNAVSEGEIAPEAVSSVENVQQTALSRIPLDEQGEPMFEAVDSDTAWDGLVEAVGGDANAVSIATAQVQQATADLEALKKRQPTQKAPKLKGSPMAMKKAIEDAEKQYQSKLADYSQQVADTQARLDAWSAILGVNNSRNAELRRQREDELKQRIAADHDAAVARFEEGQRIKAEKQAEQERIGVHAVNPKIKDKWDAAPKVEGNEDAITLPDGSTLTGRYMLTEAGAATPSHDANNAYMPTEGFPIDENGQSVNDRDYMRDKDAQQIVEGMAGNYDNRALQDPVIVSTDGVVLSGNNRTMSGDLAARRGTDKAYVDYLSKFGHKKYGFTPEQVAGMKNPRVVFVPDEALPYDATTFARFNAQEKKSQGKPEAAVKLGKIVPDNVFNNIVSDISHYDRLADYYANEKAVAHALGALMQAGVINDKQMPEMRTGTALSASGKELIENTLIGKVFQASPDAVRQIISVPTLRQSIVMGLSEIANNRTLASKGYDISEELSKAVDLVARAKTAMPDIYKDGMPVSPFGRMQGLFDDEFGDSRVTDGTALLLADILNSGKPSDLRKVLSSYNNEAAQAAGGQIDIFSGSIPTKAEILTNVNEHFRNATPKEQQALVDAAIAERKRRAEAEAEQRERSEASEQTPHDAQRSAEPQQPIADGDTELEPLGKDPNDFYEDTTEEAALRARISVGDEWEEDGPAPDKPIYKRKLYIDGKHEIIQTDAPDEKGSYIGSQLTYDGRDFGDLKEIADYIDGGMQAQQAEPTEAQKAAGNYKMEHRRVDGYNISIENAKGSVRRGTSKDKDGNETPWETVMQNDYGYIRGTEGVDGDHIDVFLSDTPEKGDVFVVDQVNKDGSFDEHKVMYGFPTEQAARDAYLSNYELGWAGLGAITHVSKEDFKKWIQSSRRKTKPFAEYKSVKPTEGNDMIGRSLTEQEATELIARMEATAEVAPEIELTIENWDAEFGEDGIVNTPIGEVKMGENQFTKLMRQGRNGKLGMVKPTLENPNIIIEDSSKAKDGTFTERESSYVFVKAFVKPDGSRYYYFTSVTVSKEGHEVVISNQEKRRNVLTNLLIKGKLVWKHADDVSAASDVEQGLYSSQGKMSDPATEGTVAPQTNKDDSLHPKAQVGKSVSLNDSSNPTNSDNETAMLGVNSSANNESLSPSSEGYLTEAPSKSEGPDLVPTSDNVSSGGKVNTLSADKQADGTESSEPYTITPTTYTNKKGKTSDVFLVKFNRELTTEEKAALNTFIREPLAEGKKTQRGWYGREQGGFMMRSEEAARQLAEMIGNEEAVADAQPMTADELREAVIPAEPAKPTEKKPAKKSSKPKKAPVNRVSLEDVMTALSTKGETKLSDHAEPIKAKPETQHEISDDEMQSLANELRDLLGIGEDEGDTNIKFRDPGELTPQERQRIQSAGIRLAMGLIERGTTAFPDYATKMVGLLGDKIRPWLKSFYEGARWTPGYDKYTFTPTEQVATFDVQNFDKKQADPIAQAAMIVEERKAADASAQAQRELTETRNKQRKQHEQQTEADTAALAEKAEAVASQAESTAKSAGTGKAGRKSILRDLKRVDDTLDEVNDQLALLGYYEAEEVDKDFNEAYGYMRNAEKKAVKDAVDLAKQLVSDLGLGLDKVTGSTTANRGKKKNAVTANIAPAGGDISIRLPLNEGRELYITIGLDPSVTPGDVTYSGDNLQATRIMYRVEWPDEKGHVSFDRMGRNCWADANVTYADLLNGIQREAKDYLPTSSAEETWQELVDMAERGESPYAITPEVETQLAEQQRADVSHNGYKVGDEVMWDRYGNGKWEKVKIEDFDTDGSPIFEAVKGVMSEKGNWERIKPVDGIFGEARRVARKAAEERKKATENAVNLLRGETKPAKKNGKSRKKDVILKPDEPIGSLFDDINEEPQKQETDERKGNQPSQEVAGGELSHPVGTDATGTDGRVSSAGTGPTDKGGAAHEAGAGVERGADRPTHGTDENRRLHSVVGNRGRDESGTDRGGHGAGVERGRTAGAGSVSERGTDRGTERLSEGESSAMAGRGSGTPAVKKPKRPEVKYTHNFRYDEENGNEADTYTPSQRLEANVKAIETLADVLFGDKPATDEQKTVMSRFRGWGQVDLGKYYDIDHILRSAPENAPISRLARVIKRLDPSGDKKLFDAIKRASLSSYYTPTPIARAMNSFLALAGYKGGSLLDPSMGNGMFEGTLPKSIQERTSITGVELDWLSGQLSRALYPDANVMISAFEKSGIAPGSFDVVTSNVPFGDIVVNDPTWKNDGTPLKRSAQNRIHNYYAVKMLEATRPGGLVAMMTTSAVMDTQSNQNIRAHIADQGEILGAIRLPDNTFQGTGVVTDIIFVRKWRDEHDREQTRADESYMETERAFLSQHEKTAPNKLDGSQQQVSFNGYYKLNPRNLIGEIQAGNQYGKKDAFGLTSKLTVDEIASEVEKAIKRIVGSRRGSLFNPSRTIRETQQAIREAYKGNGDWVSNGNLVVQDGKVGVLTAKSNEYGEVTRTFEGTLKHDRMLPRIEAMIDLRTSMKKLIAGQIEGEKEKILAALRGELQKAYDKFTGKFGRLQDKGNSFILDDIDGYTLQALEVWKDGKFVGLSDIFTKNSIKPSINLEGKKTPQEAVALSLAEYGYLRPDYLAKALGEDWVEQCGDVVFLKPNSEDDYVTRDEYLSGDVVTKLADARAAAEKDKSFERNVKALEDVQPERIPFDDITIHLGARWIPEEVLNDFVNELLGIHAVYSNRGRKWDPELGRYVNEQKSGVRYIPETDSFEIHIEKKELGGEASDWETPKKSAKEILQAALEDKTLVITYKDKDGNTHVDDEQTELANQKIADLRERFETWLPSDPARVDLMEQLYNNRFNRTVIRHFDGSHLIVPGLMGKELRPHQKDAVWMLINNRGGIVDHIVGAGKTLVMQSAIMEMRRMGIAKKPMIVALKSTVAQIAREFKEAFPSARVLAPNDSDFKKENRKKFIANISLNDYDCVILSHEQYCMLPHTEEAERAVIDEQMWQLDNMIEYLYGTNDTSQMTKKQIKALEKRRENLKARLEKRLDRAVDREFCFENLGVDYLFVDESHQFKSLPYVTSYQKVAGLGDPQGSNRAVALLTGIRHLQRMHQGDKGTVFLSGTTITNSLVEMYNIFNYLRPRKLEELGMPTFDAWASVFAEHSAELEATVTGNFAMKDRFRKFNNIQELSQLYSEIADVRNDYNLKLPKPGVEAQNEIVHAGEALTEINSEIVSMIESKDGKYFGIHPKDPNRAPWGLHASTISAKAAVSPRLIFPDMNDDGGKVQSVCENVKKYYDEMAEQRGVQLIFCEMGVPGKGKEYDAYTDMVNRFVNDYGIPRSEIAYIQEAPTEKKRKDLFQRVRDGKVRILIGGTKNMGTGVNVQDRITDAHMVTVPWTPAALEQCIGRAARQGNTVARDFMGNKVRVHYYAAEGSLDLYKYQLLDAKGKMITQVKMGTVGDGRSFDEGSMDEEGNMDPAEVVAILSGNPVIFEKAKQEKLVKKLRALRNGFERDYQRKKAKYDELQRRKENLERLIRLNDRDRADLERNGFKPDNKGVYPSTVTINDTGSYYGGGRTFDKPKEAGEYLLAALDKGKTVTLQGFGQRARVAIVNEEKGNSLFSFRELQIGEGNERSIRYSVRLSDDATAAGTAYRNLLKRIMDNGEVYRRGLEEVNSQLSGMNIGDGVFSRQAEYEEATAKLKELTAEFNKLGKKAKSEGERRITTTSTGELIDVETAISVVKRGKYIVTNNGEVEFGKSKMAENKLFLYCPNRGSYSNIIDNERLNELKISKSLYRPAKRIEFAFDHDSTEEIITILSDIGYRFKLGDQQESQTIGDGNKYRDGEEMSEGERLRAIRALVPIEVERNDMSRAELREVYSNLPAVVKGGRTIEFYRSAFKKIYKDGGLFGQVVPVLDDVLEQSVLAYSEEDNLGGTVRPDGTVHKEHPDIISFDNYVGKISVDGREYYVRTTVQSGYDGRNGTHSFFVTDVSLYEKTAPALTLPNFPSGESYMERPIENAEINSSPGYPRATEISGAKTANGLSLPITTRARVTTDGFVDAKLQQFFERASSEALELDKADRVKELSEKLNTPVRMISEESELSEKSEDGKPRYSRRERRAKGWWSAKDDEVVIVLPNNVNVADVDNTVVHEVVGHRGLRAFIGEERFDEFLGEVYDHASNPIRKVIDKMTDDMTDAEADRLRVRMAQAHERAGEDVNANYYPDMAKARVEAEKKRERFRKEATEEYMADLGGRIGSEGFEKMSRDEQTLWGKIKAKVQAFLDKFLRGLKIAKSERLTDKGLSYILFKSWKYLRDKKGKGGVFAEAEDAVMRRRTGWDDEMQVSEKRSRVEKLRRSEPVEITGEEIEYSSDIKQYKKNAVEYGKRLQGEYINEDRGKTVQLQRGRRNGGVKEVLQHDLSEKAHIQSVAAIPDIIRKSIYIESEPNRDSGKNPDVRCYEHYVCGLRIGGEDYTVHSIVAEDKSGNRYYDHKLSQIEKGRLLDFIEAKQPVERILTPMSGTEPTIRSERKIRELISLLQVEDEGAIKRFRDPIPGLEETITKMKAEAMRANANNLQAKRDAMRAIGGNLNHLRQAMARQREYDIATAKSVKDLARILMENGLLDTLGNAEVKSLLAQVTNSIGRQDVSKQVGRVFEIMVNNHLRNTELAFGKLISMRTSRVDGRGIQVQGDLDPDGQAMLKVFNRWKGLTVDEIDRRISDAIDAMSDTYAPIAERATLEYAGLQLAREYAENVAGSKNAEKMLREEVKRAKEEKDAGRMTSDAYKQFEDATRATITQMKLGRISALETLIEKLGGELAESVERAKAWRESEKERINHIHHLANSDMQGRELRGDHEDTRLMKLRNHWSFSWLLEPMSTLDQMLKMFGRQNPNGEGYMQNHFMRGWVDAADSEQIMKESVHKQMDDKAAEIFGQHRVWYNGGAKKVDYTYSDIYGYAKALPGATISYYDGADMREYEIGQGELLYLYAVDKMPMGRATNRRMGIDETTMQKITDALDPKLKEYADWVQEELLPQLGESANEVYKRMFGANMDAIENYFPFVRDKDALKREVENGQSNQTNDRISVQTGAIKKRVASVSKWNMRKCNFMDVLAKHVDEMCHWIAFAELNRDFGTLLSYNRFKQQVFAMNSVYGAGEQLWKRLQECCAIATDAYDPQRAKFDRFMVQGAKGVTMGKISFRTFTALKQTLSLPAFFGEVNMKHIAADLATGGLKACQWAWKNMPNYRKRILSRTSGDYRLKENEYDGKIMKASSYGMLPNIGVDAWTIAVGSYGVYKTRKAKYLRWGMSESDADHRAIQDAELCYNKSQQSSEGPFMAPVQVDHTFYATSAMLFRNSSTSYTREAYTSARNLKRLISGEVNEDFVAKQILRTLYPESEGAWTDEQWAKARKNAKKEIHGAYVKNTVNLAMFGWILPWLWRIGSVSPLLLLSGDDDEKNKQWEDATRQSMFGPIEGLAYGDVISDGFNMLTGANEKSIYNLGRSNPILNDILQAIKKVDKDQMEAANDVINILVGMGVGINPQTVTDWATAIIDYNSDVQTQHECALLVARLLSCPPSQLEKVYFEELDMDALEASKLTPSQLASRYAEYKMMREAPLTGWMRGAEASDSIKSANVKRVLDNAKDRIELQSNERSNVNASWLSDYETVKSRLSKIRKVKEDDEDRYYDLLDELEASPVYDRYLIIKDYKHDIEGLSKSILRAKSAQERQQLTDSLITLKRDMVKDLKQTQQ